MSRVSAIMEITALITVPLLTTPRLRLEAFTETDAPALAKILAEPDVSRTITANASTPERCLTTATFRIGWHNASWKHGYGVWAVKSRDTALAPEGELLGRRGFAAPDIGEDPEILYGVRLDCWGLGIAQEVSRAAIDWLFATTAYAGVSAVIFGRLNPVSVRVVEKFGMQRRGSMPMADFLPDKDMARDVLEYEIWRLEHARTSNVPTQLFEAPFKGGQIVSLGFADKDRIERDFCHAARVRSDCASIAPDVLQQQVTEAFREGLAMPHVDWYHLERATWLSKT